MEKTHERARKPMWSRREFVGSSAVASFLAALGFGGTARATGLRRHVPGDTPKGRRDSSCGEAQERQLSLEHKTSSFSLSLNLP